MSNHLLMGVFLIALAMITGYAIAYLLVDPSSAAQAMVDRPW